MSEVSEHRPFDKAQGRQEACATDQSPGRPEAHAIGEVAGGFELTLPLTKAWEDEQGRMWFEGVASSTRLDRQRERMTAQALEKMAQFRGLELLPSHKAGPLEMLGTVQECWADDSSFRVAGILEEENPQARILFKRVQAGRGYGLSVGGRVTRAHWGFDERAGGQVRLIDDVELDHIALCRPEQAANPDTYLAVLAKAAEEVTDTPPTEEQHSFIQWLRQAFKEAWQELWLLGKSELESGEEQPAAHRLEAGATEQKMGELEACATEPRPLQDQVEELDKRVAALEGRLAKSDFDELDQTNQDEREETASVPVEPGRRQSLPISGPARAGNQNLWKGVL